MSEVNETALLQSPGLQGVFVMKIKIRFEARIMVDEIHVTPCGPEGFHPDHFRRRAVKFSGGKKPDKLPDLVVVQLDDQIQIVGETGDAVYHAGHGSRGHIGDARAVEWTAVDGEEII